jgi:hypothetical protein
MLPDERECRSAFRFGARALCILCENFRIFTDRVAAPNCLPAPTNDGQLIAWAEHDAA